MTEQFKRSDLVKLTVLWEGNTKTGEQYFSGYLGNAKLLVFKNRFKETEKHPDWVVYVVNKISKEKQESDNGADTSPQDLSGGFAYPDDEIPF